MDDLINWDENGEANRFLPGSGAGNVGHRKPASANLDFVPVPDSDPNFDMALANIDGDDFSFWALEHFETSNLDAALNQAGQAGTLYTRDPTNSACDGCDAGGFNCKKVEDGLYQGQCTSCVALQIQCSFVQATAPPTSLPEQVSPAFQRRLTGDHNNAFFDELQAEDLRSSSSPDLVNINNGTEAEGEDNQKNPAAPKIGARFSRESVRILKNWLSTHSSRPYPTDDEREHLQRQTGLNKTQIANWLANARRRSKGKFRPTRSTSPSVRGWSTAIEIPQRRGTTAHDGTAEYLSPLQRWQNSPPENEPASVTAIASAILQSKSLGQPGSGLNSPFTFTDEEGTRSCKNSSTGSFGTSPSSGSFASAFSHQSRGSLGSFPSQRGRRRRRRRTAHKETNEKSGTDAPLKAFQCTFCTETFRTKHDWQRHEKSLHLSLERWVCCPKGPRALNSETNQVGCVFCGLVDPDNAHIEGHNYTSCQERQLDERTFYRKDHLRQHLRLVHNTKYQNWSMDSWKVPTPDIRSRCGFCGLLLSSWPVRVDHLAEHFKQGCGMDSWKGDWGFDAAVLSIIENAIPPYMIHEERSSPLPFTADQQFSQSSTQPRNGYELIKLELAYFLTTRRDNTGVKPPDDELQHEGCRIIFGSEVLSKSGVEHSTSWLRDLLMSSDELKRQAQMTPIRGKADSCLCELQIPGQDSIFEGCPLEKQLLEFVKAKTLLGMTATDEELQVEACKIIGRMEESSVMPSEDIANFLLRLVLGDSAWLSSFRQRAGLPPTNNSSLEHKGKSATESSIYRYSQLENELAEFVQGHRATMGADPSDVDLRKHARRVVHKSQVTLETTAADNAKWLGAFKQRQNFQQHNSTQTFDDSNNSLPFLTDIPLLPVADTTVLMNGFGEVTPPVAATLSPVSFGSSNPTMSLSKSTSKDRIILMNGSACYRRLARDLGRFVAKCMSPNNPDRHLPTDNELQYQARWILYDDDDPLNRTAADNAEWLLHFKRATGIVPASDDPSVTGDIWMAGQNEEQGTDQWKSMSAGLFESGTSTAPYPLVSPPQASAIDSMMDFASPVEGINTPILSMSGVVFTSKEFEDKLIQFSIAEVASSGRMPPDEAIQTKAKEISGLEVWQAETTPADDPNLLTGFKQLVIDKLRSVLGGHDKRPANSFFQYQHPKPEPSAASVLSPSIPAPDRGMDAIDPGLLPALELGAGNVTGTQIKPPTPVVHVAISEKRLDEILGELRRGGG